jgi:hypothetical protein
MSRIDASSTRSEVEHRCVDANGEEEDTARDCILRP